MMNFEVISIHSKLNIKEICENLLSPCYREQDVKNYKISFAFKVKK